ncbi:uncharacterized protein VTP21DRAFT_4740 [Calcarisporiella thermophila]|uniref:uncharacterized protein n=1 Tax=Calcarisporiella thermophila TaxID=911321 RepID=UPI003742FEDA
MSGPPPERNTASSVGDSNRERPHNFLSSLPPIQSHLSISQSSLARFSAPLASNPDRKHVLRYDAPWPMYGLDWCKRSGERDAWRIAVGSLVEESVNKLKVVSLPEYLSNGGMEDSSIRPRSDLVTIAETDHIYPATKILWEPSFRYGSGSDLIATSSDCLRLYELHSESRPDSNGSIHARAASGYPSSQQKLTLKTALKSTKSEFAAPLTSFDWSEVDPTLIVTGSIDTTCTIWNVETQQPKTQLLAHLKEVYDVAFMPRDPHAFLSTGADGTVRLFDIRSLENSSILYGNPPPDHSTLQSGGSNTSAIPTASLLRLAINRHDSNLLATFHVTSRSILILDIRMGKVLAELQGHGAPVNCVSWAPHLRQLLVSGGDDSQVLVWDIHDQTPAPNAPSVKLYHPILAYTADAEVSQLCWSVAIPDWIVVGFGRSMQALKI